ncbi:MAG: PLP-dependent aspartate aminotransferase family protein [Negativicutes bacterium]
MFFESRVVHAGVCTDSATGAISTPIYQTATFRHPALGQSTGYDYSRTKNPTRQAVEQAIATLEQGVAGFAFASGMAAISTVLMLFQPGDHLIVSEDCYGGTYRVLDKIFAPMGLQATFVDSSSTEALAGAVLPNTRAILVETPTNPLMKIVDLRKLVGLARMNNLLTIVDNTFLTPYLQRPLEIGADIVIHSGSKYLSGHNDVVCGLAVAREKVLGDKIGFLQNALGTILGPQDSWLLLRGMKTLALRMEKHNSNAMVVAEWLCEHPKVARVYYPGISEHPGHTTQMEQADGHGGMISFLVTEAELVPQVLARVQMLRFAESLGGVESLITFPAVQTHADIPVDIREKLGITDRLLRLSVGIEHPGDIIEDLAQALG